MKYSTVSRKLFFTGDRTRATPLSAVLCRRADETRDMTVRGGLAACAMAVLALVSAPPVAAHDRVNNTVIASSGKTAPAGGDYFSFHTVVLGERRQVVFDASLRGANANSGVFQNEGTTTQAIALGTNPDPNTGAFGSLVGSPSIAGNDVIFTKLTIDANFTNAI